MPKSVADLTVVVTGVKAIHRKKIQYSWKGHKVDVTPKKHRMCPPDTVAKDKRDQYATETTPDRALRKMSEKIRQSVKTQSVGQVPSIMAKQLDQTKMDSGVDFRQKIERALNDEISLFYATESLEFLNSMSLFHCWNCDEEWPVFEQYWPQCGTEFVGDKAGKSEVLEKHGFAKSAKHPELCSRCASRVSYRQMFCKDNWQHLGLRHPVLSSLTWYESQLVARVHAVMSVLTLTATGMLCFAGHVCNYYQKVMEWVQSLPAVLREKQFFVVKRRRSLRAPSINTRQKKPITANFKRLQGAILECHQFMPTVYAHSWINEEQLRKVTYQDGEEEKEPEDNFELRADVSNDIFLRFEVFDIWMRESLRDKEVFPIGMMIWNTAKDAQTEDLRDVSSDSVWEFCCRMLSESAATDSLRTSHISMMILHWIENAEIMDSASSDQGNIMDVIFADVDADASEKLANAMTQKDLDAARVKWTRLKVHAELEEVHERTMCRDKECVLDLDVGAGLMTNPQGMFVQDSNNIETVLSAEQEAEHVAVVYQEQLREDVKSSCHPASSDSIADDGKLRTSHQTMEDRCGSESGDHHKQTCMAILRKINKKWIVSKQDALEEARAQQRKEHVYRNWQKCAELDKTIADIKSSVQIYITRLQTMLDEVKDEAVRQKIEDCVMQLTCLLGSSAAEHEQNDVCDQREKCMPGAALENELNAAVQDDNVDRADKIEEVMKLQKQWEDELRSNDHEKALRTLICLKLARRRLEKDKPLVDPPELGDLIRDSDKQPYWIPGAFPTIFQNETGDPYNYFFKEPDLQLWGPHILMSKGWVAQEHPTFLYWWLNLIQRRNANAAKKWFIAENKDSVSWTVEERYLGRWISE